MSKKYIVRTRMYQYNSGAGDNGARDVHIPFYHADQAMEFYGILIKRLESGDPCEDIVQDHIWDGFITEISGVFEEVTTITPLVQGGYQRP